MPDRFHLLRWDLNGTMNYDEVIEALEEQIPHLNSSRKTIYIIGFLL